MPDCAAACSESRWHWKSVSVSRIETLTPVRRDTGFYQPDMVIAIDGHGVRCRIAQACGVVAIRGRA
ncbi:MAG: hypothetical protein U5P41_16160 [Gammaproteobacteria bacterium]|nr:hypothetical protein [Gammaproteobacteria bacterium]